MRELRSTGNAFFWFALFLLGYALVVPPPEGTGHGSAAAVPPDGDRGVAGRRDTRRRSTSPSPGSSSAAASTPSRPGSWSARRTSTSTTRSPVEIVREVWKELSEKPEGTDVVRARRRRGADLPQGEGARSS